jgi:hypothetical protein
MPSFIRAALICMVVVLRACAGRTQDTAVEPEGPAVVEVENQGFIPRYLTADAGPIRFLADPIGGNRTPVSEEMSVRPGDVVTLTIPPQ